MANPNILFMDGGERNSMSKWNSKNFATLAVGSTGFTGSYYIGTGAYEQTDSFSLPSAQSEIYMAFKFKALYDIGVRRYDIMKFKDSAGTACLAVENNKTSKKIEIRLGDYNGSLLETGDIVLESNTLYSIEIYYKPLNTGGECTVKVDGVVDATYTGDTTAGLENVQTFVVYGSRFGYDDIIVSNTTWLGNVYITGFVPKSAGDATTWDPSTGANYTCVDEVTASDTDYVSTNTADESDLYNIDSLTGVVSSVLAVNLCVRAAYEGTPTPTKVKPVIKHGGTEYYGSDISPALTFADYFYIWDQDPSDSGDLTEADIASLQIGVRSVA